MADTLQKKTIASTCMKPLGVVLTILLTSPSFVLSGRIPPIPAGHRAQYLLLRPDGSYSSGYDTGLGHVGIAHGNALNEVRGAYAAGPLRVFYTAGVGGYIPTVEVQDPPPPGPAVVHPPSPPPLRSPPRPSPPPFLPRSAIPIETADASVLLNPDGSYAFSYRTSDQRREESADSQNNVRGSFSFVPPDDGIRRTVNYQAGAQTGFVAEGAHLPTPPQPVPPTTPVTEQTPPTTDTEEPENADGSTTPSTEEGSGNNDASYAFAYRTPDQERVEVSDPAGNVRGLFSFVAPDGIARRVDYAAGANTGFIARGDHLPTPPPVPSGETPQDGVESRTPAPSAPHMNSGQWKSGAWNADLWPVTVPDPMRIDSNLGNAVVHNYLPSHPQKAGYVLEIKE